MYLPEVLKCQRMQKAGQVEQLLLEEEVPPHVGHGQQRRRLWRVLLGAPSRCWVALRGQGLGLRGAELANCWAR